MANYDITLVNGVSIAQRVHHAFDLWRERRAQDRVFRTTRRELLSLSMRELADLGIGRSEIYGIAYRTAYGKEFKG